VKTQDKRACVFEIDGVFCQASKWLLVLIRRYAKLAKLTAKLTANVAHFYTFLRCVTVSYAEMVSLDSVWREAWSGLSKSANRWYHSTIPGQHGPLSSSISARFTPPSLKPQLPFDSNVDSNVLKTSSLPSWRSFERLIERFVGLILHRFCHMRVASQCDRDVGMPQPLLNHLWIDFHG
jgi:hypothetical protein